MESKIKHLSAQYESVRAERNAASKQLVAAQQEILDLKREYRQLVSPGNRNSSHSGRLVKQQAPASFHLWSVVHNDR